MDKFYLIVLLLVCIVGSPAIADRLDDGVALYFDDGDSEKAIKVIQPFADKGNAEAQYYMGLIHYDIEQYKAAFAWFMKSAKQDFTDGQMAIASLYKNGEDIKKNGKIALEWYKKVADKGIADAEVAIALIYAEGVDVKVNAKKAIDWYTKAANKGDDYARYSLGEIYAQGKIIKRDGKKAIEWYTKAASTGDPLPLLGLAQVYCNGIDIKQDLEKCAHWAKKVKEADFDVADLWAKFELGKYE